MVPIVLIIFNRPKTTKRVFEVLSQIRPEKLFIIADGPRSDRPLEAALVKETRVIVENTPWPCEVFKNYSEVNLGCNTRVSTGLDWVFGQVNEAIILEDDCLPDLSFFGYCEELLKFYRNDPRVMHISGDRFVKSKSLQGADYSFSKYPHCWGWATWKRAWKNYDVNMSQWPKLRGENWLEKVLDNGPAIKFWKKIFDLTYEKKINSWAYRWMMTCWLHNGISINPKVNLVSNLGFGVDATHTGEGQSPLSNLAMSSINLPLNHSKEVRIDSETDRITEKEVFNITSPQSKIFRRIKKIFREIRQA